MHRTHTVINLDNLEHNVRALRSKLRRRTLQMAVVKADAYGHGAVPVAQRALLAGCDWLGVATVQEAEELRLAGIHCPILVLGVAPAENSDKLIEQNARATLCDAESARMLSERATAAGTVARVHVKVDTGMGRLGLSPEEAPAYLDWLLSLPGLQLEGVYSHFATADETDLQFARLQLQRFNTLLENLRQRGIPVSIRHMANSAATLVLPESHFDMVRNGITLYGLYPSPALRCSTPLRPVLRWETRISQLKEVAEGIPLSYGCSFTTTRPSRIATLPVGYADGYARSLSNRARVVVRGKAVPIVGRVCMDMILADVTDVQGVALGDTVTLLGRDGKEEITADELADLCGTINYEITCNIGKRVPRLYQPQLEEKEG